MKKNITRRIWNYLFKPSDFDNFRKREEQIRHLDSYADEKFIYPLQDLLTYIEESKYLYPIEKLRLIDNLCRILIERTSDLCERKITHIKLKESCWE